MRVCVCVCVIGPTGRLVLQGQKYAWCIGDTAQHFPGGTTVGCMQKNDCGSQGIQKGWIDSYGILILTSIHYLYTNVNARIQKGWVDVYRTKSQKNLKKQNSSVLVYEL